MSRSTIENGICGQLCCVFCSSWKRDVLFYEPTAELLKKLLIDRIRPALIWLGDLRVQGGDADLLKKKDSTIEIRVSGGGSIHGLTPGMKTGNISPQRTGCNH